MSPIRKKILYVDDESINLELFRMCFNADYEIVIAASGNDGLEKYKNDSISLVVSDLKMPGMNGIEMIQEIKKINVEQPCILLTAFVDPDVMLKAINESLISKYVIKPWKKNDLKKIIDEALDAA
jgi:two-component system, response regulator, stage 0 sporulation protein F